jgi:type IV pilus assembly protein PilE
MKIKNSIGFTLIELLMVLVIIAVLLGYAVPTYREYVLRSQRSEAQNALLQLSGIQERFYANNNRYGNATEINMSTLFPAPTVANNLHYTISIATTNTTYTIKATAYGSQTDDTACLEFTLDNLGQKTPGGNCW